MSVSEIIRSIDKLQEDITSFGKLDVEILNKINYRFRLDWNFHSNAMEGNSLTQQETRSVMVNNVTVEGKPIKDVLEMKGHDDIISQILKIGKGELKLSEARIQAIHKGIMHEEAAELTKKIGTWKTQNNHLINYKGEKFEFVPYQEVAEEMHKLINWLNSEYDKIFKNDKAAVHPVLLAFEFHLRYVSIHPFYDGNGRTARILMNLILIAFGFPPVIIKVQDKDTYNRYLADIQAYGGSSDLFFEFMGKQLLHSQDIVLKAIKGISIEEVDDLDKKLLLLEKELDAIDPDEAVKYRFDAEVFFKLYDNWIAELIRKAIPLMQKFNKFFTGTAHQLSASKNVAFVQFSDETAEVVLSKFFAECVKNKNNIIPGPNLVLSFNTHYGTLIKGGIDAFGCNYGFDISFDFIKYKVEIDEFSEGNYAQKRLIFPERLLHKPLSPAEMDLLIKTLGDTIYHHIDVNTKKRGIR